MQIGNQTTFTQIQQQFEPGGLTPGRLANKHLRFDGGNQLYTHSSSPFKISGFGAQAAQARAQKHADGANQVKAAIDREFGAGTANRVFASIQQQTGRNLDQGVKRSDLAAIQQSIQVDQQHLQAARAAAPTGLTIAADGLVGGSTTVTHATDGRPLGDAVEQRVGRELGTTQTVHGQVISSVSARDMDRMHIDIPDPQGGAPFSTYRAGNGAIVPALRAFAGSDAATTVLSSVLSQNILNPVHMNLTRGDGENVILMPATSQGTYSFKQNNGALQNIQNPQQYGAARMQLSQLHNGDFRVQIDWPTYFTGFNAPGAEGRLRPNMHADDAVLKATYSTSWIIDGAEAAQGRISLGVETPLRVDYEGRMF